MIFHEAGGVTQSNTLFFIPPRNMRCTKPILTYYTYITVPTKIRVLNRNCFVLADTIDTDLNIVWGTLRVNLSFGDLTMILSFGIIFFKPFK